jgi:hypothetical protein
VKGYLDGSDLLNTLKLDTTIEFFLVVEGEDDYELLFEHLADGIALTVGYGKPSVVEAASLASADGFGRAVFLVDVDFDHMTGMALTYPASLLATASYDLAMDIIATTPSLVDRLAMSLASPFLLMSKVPAGPSVLVDEAWNAASYLGACRLANQLRGWGLNLSRFPMDRVLDQLSGSAPPGAVFDLIELRSTVPIPSRVDLELDVAAALAGDTAYLINSHDLFAALSQVVLRETGSTRAGAEVLFRAMVGCVELHASAVYRQLSALSVVH